MGSGKYLFTSESVSMGHPDKLADQISDGVLDAIFAEDPHARVACETLVTTGIAILAGLALLFGKMFGGGKTAPDAAEMEKMQAELAGLNPDALPEDLKDLMKGGAVPDMGKLPQLPQGLPGVFRIQTPGQNHWQRAIGGDHRPVETGTGTTLRRHSARPGKVPWAQSRRGPWCT